METKTLDARELVSPLSGAAAAVEADKLQMTPCIPAHWRSFQVHYRYRRTPYRITVTQTPGVAGPAGLTGLALDGTALPGPAVPLLDDGREHRVEAEWHAPAPAPAGGLK